VANTGNVTLTGITVTEESFSGAGALPAPVFVSATAGSSEATLLVGGVLTYTATYAVEQADIDAGGVTNQARATGTDPNDEPVTDLSDDDSNLEDEPTETPIDQDPAIAIIKTGSYDAGTGEITYTFTVANTGNVTLTGITVTEESFSGAGALPAPAFVSATAGSSEATLLVGGVLTYTATYAVEQADIDAGGVTNQARATGTDPNDEPVTDLSDNDSNLENEPTETPIGQDPAIAIIKTGSYDAGTGEITYTFTVANTGNVTLTGIAVTEESFSGAGALPAPVFVSATAGSSEATLLVGGVLTYTATYTVEQADIDAGGVTNQARATGTDPNDEPVTDLSDDDSNLENEPTETPIGQDPAIAIIKTSSVGGTGAVNDVISYTFTVTNTGNVTLTGVTVTDPLSGLSAIAPASVASLAPGALEVFTATYTITQDDIEAGGVENQATATGTDPNGDPVTDLSDDNSNLEDDPTFTPLCPVIVAVQSDDPTDCNVNDGKIIITAIGADLEYSIDGGLTFFDNNSFFGLSSGMYNVVVRSTLNGCQVPFGQVTLMSPPAPMFDNAIANTVSDCGAADGQIVIFASGGSTGVFEYSIDGGSTWSTSNVFDNLPEGFYPIRIRNADGTCAVAGPTVQLVPPAAPQIDFVSIKNPSGCGVDNGMVTIFASGGDPGLPLQYSINNGLSWTNNNMFSDLAEGAYEVRVRNGNGTCPSGPVTITLTAKSNPVITDVSSTQPDCDELGSITVAADGGEVPGEYLISIDGGVSFQSTTTGSFTFTGLSSGTYQIRVQNSDGSCEVSWPDVVLTSTCIQIDLQKSASFNDLDNDGFAQPGETITYTFTVTNTGDVTVSGLVIDDAQLDLVGQPVAPSTLTPGQTGTATATYVLTQADIDAGQVINTATATGQDPQGNPVSDDSDTGTDPQGNPIDDPETVDSDGDGDPGNDPTVTGLPQNPALYVSKVGVLDLGNNGVPDIGDVINYTIVVTNTGNVTISDITLADPNADPGSISCTPAEAFTLAPGESATCTAVHTLNADDLETRVVINVATATGQTPNGDPISQDSDDPQTLEPNDPTIIELPCVTIETWVYLEGAAILPDGSANYALPMRTTLNNLRLLPGQTYNDFFLGTQYTLPGQPYNTAPWNYAGNEGDAFDSMGDLNFADADYPATVVDWVLVSLRDTPDGANGPICQAAALLHSDGRVEFVGEFACCDIDLGASYYLVIEHRNHLIVMSHEPIPIANGKIVYDFRVQQSYINDPFLFGTFAGQKEILPGVFAMLGSNGNQTLTTNSDTDINFDDRTFWESENGDIAKYRNGDYNLNGDTNFNDRRVWELNNGKFTSVPRD
jgi:uncharacterized repeat protein (TIGR01451 family)